VKKEKRRLRTCQSVSTWSGLAQKGKGVGKGEFGSFGQAATVREKREGDQKE